MRYEHNYILNGPNLNLLGKRQPHIYGYETLEDLERICGSLATELGRETRFHQSNREYEIIDWIHEAREAAQGIVLNPAAFTHNSVAILDALNTFSFAANRSARRSATGPRLVRSTG
ncbi:type II 3-dehydroquinate dehydratase [Rhizobium deserti]|uniref:3-dehydroquinate dehydratase n=1 Tax=Rhizobium deserti TaxID=2547961 RepID=A0A4V3AN48_9HYPH|nr:type II 3-dehydroquinate dehydratase [Rhizobium deserti]